MNRRLAISIGVGLIILGLASLGYVGYLLFGGTKTGDTASTSFFSIESVPLDDTAPANAAVVVAKFSPPAGDVNDWACGVRAWDWGDGQVTRDNVCSPFVESGTLEFPADHQYSGSGTYTVRVYIRNEQGDAYQSDELELKVR